MSSARIGMANDFLRVPAKPHSMPESSTNNLGSEKQEMAPRHVDTDSRLIETLERIDRRLDTVEANGKGKLNGWAQPIMTGLVVFVAMFGVKLIPESTSQSNERMRMMEYRQEQLEVKNKDIHKETRLMEQYNRDLYLWLNDRGLRNIPPPPVLQEEK